MALGKQAKTLTDGQQRVVLSHLASGRHSKRNTLIFLLSVDAGAWVHREATVVADDAGYGAQVSKGLGEDALKRANEDGCRAHK